ncbi:magnesium transporter NIPA-domain-containing protein [Crucibulum laeve]|uniref:Magnesium transporter NIPA-domain-containing protein n=1 Tax=Crucibulum laeve TaxID=68775 RepID=A0A5C3MEN7_9AGAR|nr:magnesium transporter NIPA-domain-containing protein [Crucibulum laeve]
MAAVFRTRTTGLLSMSTWHFQGMDDLPRLTTATFIGIMVAITGNILISLALNLQKLAHKRVKAKQTAAYRHNGQQKGRPSRGDREDAGPSLDENDEDRERNNEDRDEGASIGAPPPMFGASSETQPLIPFPESHTGHYGSTPSEDASVSSAPPEHSLASRLVPLRFRSKPQPGAKSPKHVDAMLPVDVMSEEAALHGIPVSRKKKSNDLDEDHGGNESDYLKSKLWWLGFCLMNVGEIGNFISYAYAPASVVAPLGTFALMANCLFAPLLLKEQFRKRDLLGIFIAIIGAVTVVLSTNASDIRLNPDALVRAICQLPFAIYCGIYIAGAMVLSTLSHGNIGRNWVFVDVGLCALFGGFTVLSTKALSTLLTMEWIDIFTKWITYPVLAVLILTGIGQIRYLNRALMRFDSKVVIPVQFVLFTLSAIIGSAILYGDFKRAKFHEIITFLYGCAATFAGVFIIAWAPNQTIGQYDEAPMNGLDGVDGTATPTADGTRLGLGTIGRRRRATLILPSGVTGTRDPREMPTLRRKQSAINLIGISPAQHLLLVHTPPREIPPLRIRDGEPDVERGTQSPMLAGRRRTMSWFGNEERERSEAGTRDSSIVGRLRNGAGRVGSLPDPGQTIYR